MIPLLEDLDSLSPLKAAKLLAGDAISMTMMIALGDAGVADHCAYVLRNLYYAKKSRRIEAFYGRTYARFPLHSRKGSGTGHAEP